MRRRDEVVTFPNVTVKVATDKALFCVIEGEEIWIPSSQIQDESEVYDADENSSGNLVLSEWIAKQKNLI